MSTINRDYITVKVRAFTAGKDAYGVQRTQGYTDREIKMDIKQSGVTIASNPQYKEVTAVGITKDTAITPSNEIIVGNDKYLVLYTIPSARFNTVLLKMVS